MDKPKLKIYTDGSCLKNPGGNGGIGIVYIYKDEIIQKSSIGFTATTNNRMELMACIVALEKFKKSCIIKIFSDSKYVIDSIEKRWVYKWEKNNWKKKGGVKNIDLWKRMLKILPLHEVKFEWVKGHNNDEGNELCDKLAYSAAKGDKLILDKGYNNDSNN